MATTCPPDNAALMLPRRVGVLSSVLLPLLTKTGVSTVPTLPLVFALSVTVLMAAVCVGTAASTVKLCASEMIRPAPMLLPPAA